jgi:predicted nucleic acid-binding protein
VKRTKPRRLSEPDEDLPPEASSLRYIESSALVAAVLERDAEAMSQIHEIGRRVASALTFAESSRAVIRARVRRQITPGEERAALRELRTVEAQSTVLAITRDVLTRAGKLFPVEPVRALDAIHLATLESLGETPPLVTVVTRDDRIARNARALGYAIAP